MQTYQDICISISVNAVLNKFGKAVESLPKLRKGDFMKLSNASMFFWMLFICGFAVILIGAGYIVNQETLTEKNKEILLNSVMSGMSMVSNEDGYCFDTEEKRKTVMDAFYRAYNDSKSRRGEDYNTYFEIPCVAMVDEDGFYIAYNQEYTSDDYYDYMERYESQLYTYADRYGAYNVRFYLSDMITVTKISNSGSKSKSGNYREVYEYFGEPIELKFMGDKDLFHEERAAIIRESVEEQVQAAINNQPVVTINKENVNYTIIFSDADTDSVNGLNNPSLIAFYQGPQKRYADGMMNIYALTASEMGQGDIYYVHPDTEGELFYHIDEDCSSIPDGSTLLFKGTSYRCAEYGANPCLICTE